MNMKFSVSSLKSLNYKQLLIDHVEKIIFGIIILCTVSFLYGTQWKPYSQTPQDLKQVVTESEEKLKESQWPEKAKEEYNNDENIVEQIKEVFDPLDGSQFVSNNGIYEPLVSSSKPYQEPKWLTVSDLKADYGRGPFFAFDPNKKVEEIVEADNLPEEETKTENSTVLKSNK